MFFPYFPLRLESSHQQIVAHFNTMEYPRGTRDPLRAKSLSTGLVLDDEPTGSPACRLPVTPRLDDTKRNDLQATNRRRRERAKPRAPAYGRQLDRDPLPRPFRHAGDGRPQPSTGGRPRVPLRERAGSG